MRQIPTGPRGHTLTQLVSISRTEGLLKWERKKKLVVFKLLVKNWPIRAILEGPLAILDTFAPADAIWQREGSHHRHDILGREP